MFTAPKEIVVNGERYYPESEVRSLQEQLEAAHEALRHIAGWARDELRDGPPELGLILGEAERVLGSNPAIKPHPCPKGDNCALNKGAVHCNHCGRNWPPDETWASAPASDPDLAYDPATGYRRDAQNQESKP